jgi:hypothetical protein
MPKRKLNLAQTIVNIPLCTEMPNFKYQQKKKKKFLQEQAQIAHENRII